MLLWMLLIFGTAVSALTETKALNNLTDLEQRVEILEVQMDFITDEVEEIEVDVNQLDDEMTIIEETVIDNTNDIADLTISVDDTQDEMVTLLQRMSLLEEQMGVLQGTIAAQEQIIAEMQATDNSTDDRLQTVENDIDVIETDVQAVESELLDTQGRLADVEEEVETHDGDIATLRETMSILEDIVDDVEDGMVAIEAENTEIQQRLGVLEEAIIIPWVACASSPCDNGGSCVDVNVDTFVCMCRDRYFGATCEQSYSDTSFLATVNVITLTPTDPIVFDTPVINTGGHYNASSGIYTVPVDGTYEFVVHISCSDTNMAAYLRVDGQYVAYLWNYSAYSYRLMESVMVLSLTQGQEVWVSPYSISTMYGASNSDGMYSWFSAHLIHAF